MYNTIYLRQTIADYDNSNSNQTGYEGDNRMASYQIGVEKKSKISKAIMCFITIFMTGSMMKGE